MCPNKDAHDLLSINGRVVQLCHQSREVSDDFRKFQHENSIPSHKVITVVRTNATRWMNQKKQITRNNLMRPVIDPVLSAYRREHATDTAIIEKASRARARKDIRFTDDQWNANLELEGFLTKPGEIKETLEHRLTVTGAQRVQLMLSLKASNKSTRPLRILLFPKTAALKHRKREESTVKADDLSDTISTGREEMIKQINQRFVEKRFSDVRLIQIYMSKQMDASKVLSEDNFAIAKALYLQWLRALAAAGVCGVGARTSPRKKKKKDLFADLESDDEEDSPVDTSDRVRNEMKAYENVSAERVNAFKDKFGLIDEFKLMYALREELKLHCTLFQQVSAHLAHEGNAEETFSLSGNLSNSNTMTQPGFLATLVRINKNRTVYDPDSKEILSGYKQKYRKLPTLGDDVTDAEDSDDDALDDTESEED